MSQPETIRLKHPGVPVPYDPDIAELLLERMEDGALFRGPEGICGRDGIPAWNTICKWKRVNPGFETAYAQARANSAEACEHLALEVAMAAHDRDSAAAARVKCEAIWRTAAARNPRVYGNKVDVNHTGQITLESLVTQSIRLVDQAVNGRLIEGEQSEPKE